MRRAYVAALIALGACSPSDSAVEGVSGKVEVGALAPAYATLALDGDSVSLAHMRGRVVLLNVWATWCHPCRDEIPELQAIHTRYQARGMELVGVSVDTDGNDGAIREFMKEFKMTYPVWRDPDERVLSQFLVIGVPATFLIDKAGVMRWRKTGPIMPGDTSLSNAIERALGT